MGDFIGYNAKEGEFQVTGKYFYLFIILSTVVIAGLIVFLSTESNKVGFTDGYICAYEHYEAVGEGELDLDNYTPSEYCKNFAQLFDYYASQKVITVNGANIPIQDLTPQSRRSEIEKAYSNGDTNDPK